ncbi:hypothetical protein ACVITL_002800 [Rhizobium pisi]
MKKIALAFLLVFASFSFAHAQIAPLPVGPNIAVSGNITAKGLVSSTNNTTAAGPTNSGVALSAAPDVADTLFFDASQTANNRTYEILGFQGGLNFRFKNDAGNSATTWLKASGGQAAGITGITSNSGSGAWVHTGAFAANSLQSKTVFTVATLPTCNAGAEGTFAAVSDAAAAPVYNATAAGGGSVHLPVYCNGTNWTNH